MGADVGAMSFADWSEATVMAAMAMEVEGGGEEVGTEVVAMTLANYI